MFECIQYTEINSSTFRPFVVYFTMYFENAFLILCAEFHSMWVSYTLTIPPALQTGRSTLVDCRLPQYYYRHPHPQGTSSILNLLTDSISRRTKFRLSGFFEHVIRI